MAYGIENRVIVRVWTSEENIYFPGHNVGHVSIETPNHYISLWPGSRPDYTQQERIKHAEAQAIVQRYPETQRLEASSKSGVKDKSEYLKALLVLKKDKLAHYFKDRTPFWQTTYEEDCKAEGDAENLRRLEPELTLCFYTLNCFLIEEEFKRAQTETTAWRLIGANLFFESLQRDGGFALSKFEPLDIQKLKDYFLYNELNLNVQQPELFLKIQRIEVNKESYKKLSLTLPEIAFLKDFLSKQPDNSLSAKLIGGKVDSCVSLAKKLLRKGGIMNLATLTGSSSFLSQTSSYVEVDDMLELLIPAKINEINQYPHTRSINFLGETPLERLESIFPKKSCILL